MANSDSQARPSDRKRVVITGLGAITPIGNTLTEYWEGLVSGRNGIGAITHFDASKHDCRIAGELKNFDPLQYLEKKAAKRMDRFAQLAVCATKQAMTRFGFEDRSVANADRVGVIPSVLGLVG